MPLQSYCRGGNVFFSVNHQCETLLSKVLQGLILLGIVNSAVQTYGDTFTSSDSGFQVSPFFQSLGVFVYTFASSFIIGATMGCATALLTKFTHIRDFPLLETCLFFLMSYSTFLIAEAADLTGSNF